jgi:hypothetical protein
VSSRSLLHESGELPGPSVPLEPNAGGGLAPLPEDPALAAVAVGDDVELEEVPPLDVVLARVSVLPGVV